MSAPPATDRKPLLWQVDYRTSGQRWMRTRLFVRRRNAQEFVRRLRCEQAPMTLTYDTNLFD